MKKHSKILLFVFAVCVGTQPVLFGFNWNPLSWLQSLTRKDTPDKDQKIDPEILEKYKNEIQNWLRTGYGPSSKKSALQQLNEIIPVKHAVYRKYLVNEKNGEQGLMILKGLLARTGFTNEVQVFEKYVQEWHLDLDEAPVLHMLVQQSGDAPSLVKKAIELGADPNKIDKKGDLPLHLVANEPRGSQVEVLRVLIEHGADLDAIDSLRRTPAHKKASECTDASLALLNYLLLEDENHNEILDFQGKSVKDIYRECMKKRR